LIPEARALDDRLLGMAGKDGGALGRGGMYTKIMAAQQAARSGAMTVIANGRIEGVLEQLRAGESVGSLLYPDLKPQAARKRWLASHKQTRGVLVIDAGAADALKAKGRSLLPVGVTEVRGVFDRGDIVAIETTDGERLATGLVNYGSSQAGADVRKNDDTTERKPVAYWKVMRWCIETIWRWFRPAPICLC
jgi:glutamate 5-kinase